MKAYRFLCCVVALALVTGPGRPTSLIAETPQTGTFSGTIKFKGDIPDLPPLVKQNDPDTKDAAVCAAKAIPDESLVVDQKSRGIANVFVYLRKRPKDLPEDDGKQNEKPLVLEQKGCRYVPHAMILHTNQRVKVVNRDQVAHNAHNYPIINSPVGILLQLDKGTYWEFSEPEILPMKVSCDIHPWMEAWMLVVDHPFAAVTNKDGQFKIEGLPPGEHDFRIWHEESGWLEKSYKVTIEAGQESEVNLNYTTKDFEE